MAVPTLIATPGATDANSYATVAEGTTYHEARLHSEDWTGSSVTDDTRTVALIMATRLLDAHFAWVQYQTTTEQALQWPRVGVTAANELQDIADDEIPNELKNAVCEFARQLIAEDRSLDSDVETQGLTSLKAGPVTLQFKNEVEAKPIPDAVINLLPRWWYKKAKGRSTGVRELMRA